MKEGYRYLSLDGQWTIEGTNLEEGLLPRKAYEPAYQPKDPVPAQVPGIVQNHLFQAGRIEDPHWEMNNEKILWIDEKEWWYFKDFTVPGDIQGRKYHIVLEGITYRANVWLAGVSIGNVEGMFLRHYLDVTHLVKPGKTYRLSIRCRALENSSEDRPGGKIKRGAVRSSGVVAPFSYWWNWSPHMVPIGIWKSVWLRITGGAILADPFVRTQIHWDDCEEADSAKVTTTVDVESNFAEAEQCVIRGKITGIGFNDEELSIKQAITLKPGANKVEISQVLTCPRLWWPNGLGGHPLYRIELSIEDSDGVIMDYCETEFGVRELAYLQNDDAEWVQAIHGQSNRLWSIVGKPYPWTFSINRKRVFVRGTNWVPMDNLLRLTEERYKLYLDQVEASNLNMLRIWAGGIQETETFYKLCDRKGIMTWAEFWLACASYPVMPHDLFMKCAINEIKCIRNHPSVVMWSGGNEYNPDEPENKELVDKLARVCEEHDPTRSFRRGSPYKGDRHGGLLMLPTRTSNKYNGDILNGDARLVLYRAEVAVMRSVPMLESIKKFMGEDKIWPMHKQTWQYHHAVIGEQERDAREYGGLNDIEHWIMATQIAHGQSHRHNLEYCRQTKYWSSGCMQWQINGSWPSFHRELIDWYGVPKGSFYAYKRAAQDDIVVADMEKYTFDGNETFNPTVYAITDKQLRLGDVQVKAVIYDLNMKLLHTQEATVTVEADSSAKAFQIDWRVPANYLRKVFFLHLEMRQFEELLAENLYWVGTTGYARPTKLINLNGYWEFQVGKKKNEMRWKKTVMPAYWAKPPVAPSKSESAFYTRKVKIPADWKGTDLEVFCAGFEGNDEVFFNGVRIGGTEEEMTVQLGTDDLLYTEKWAERMAQEKGGATPAASNKPAVKGDKQNIRISSDPYIVPNLIKRFYPIPARAVKWGQENLLEVRLYGEHATGISEPVYIREASSSKQQRAIVDFDNERTYLADLKNLPAVGLDVEVFHEVTKLEAGQSTRVLIRIRNNSDAMAFFAGLKVKGIDEVTTQIYSDNWFPMLPKTEKQVWVKLVNDKHAQGSYQAQFEITGWNVKRKKIGSAFKMVLK
jgi:beta-mannosidase